MKVILKISLGIGVPVFAGFFSYPHLSISDEYGFWILMLAGVLSLPLLIEYARKWTQAGRGEGKAITMSSIPSYCHLGSIFIFCFLFANLAAKDNVRLHQQKGKTFMSAESPVFGLVGLKIISSKSISISMDPFFSSPD